MRFNRPCLKCNTLHRDKGDYCSTCRANYERQREADPERRAKKRALYNSEYQRRRKALVTTTIEHNLFCHLCNKPFMSAADITADHLLPGRSQLTTRTGTSKLQLKQRQHATHLISAFTHTPKRA